MQQLIFDYTRQNTKENQAIFDCNKEHFSNQCRIVYDALRSGKTLTVRSAMIELGVGDLRRRCKDLRDYHGIDVKSRLIDGKFKEYYL